jgi:hypothetical protein
VDGGGEEFVGEVHEDAHEHVRRSRVSAHAFQPVDCFAGSHPVVVPAQTLLSQRVWPVESTAYRTALR